MNRTVVVITDRTLLPVASGNDRRIIDLMRALRAEGFRVVLLVPSVAGSLFPRISSAWRRLRLRSSADYVIRIEARKFSGGSPAAYDCTPFMPAIARAVERFDPVGVVAEYCWLAPVLDAVSNGALKSVDTHDLMHTRYRLFGSAPAAWVECTRAEEIGLLARADVILAIQRHEQREFRAMLPDKTVLCVPHACWIPKPVHFRNDRSDTVAFIGSANTSNILGLQAFIKEAWPRIRRSRPAARLRVYGKVAEVLTESLMDDGIDWIGYVGDVKRVYRKARVIINPLQLGTGLKIKTVEALAYGKALVTTTCGAAGCEEGAGDAFVMEDDMHRFADAVSQLLTDDVHRLLLQQRARRFAEAQFSPHVAMRELVATLEAHGRSRATPSSTFGGASSDRQQIE
jgi:glycosyltransferase involved in cell wall biosynthesis